MAEDASAAVMDPTRVDATGRATDTQAQTPQQPQSATPPTPNQVTNQVAAAAAGDPGDINYDEIVELEGGKRVRFGDLVETMERYEALQQKVSDSGFDAWQRAAQGDPAALQEFIAKMTGTGSTAPANVPNAGNSPPPATDAAQPPQAISGTDTPGGINPAEWAEVRQLFSQIRAEKIRGGIQSYLKKPEFAALSRRPDATEQVIEQLSRTSQQLQAQGKSLQNATVLAVLGEMNRREQEYQDAIRQSMKSEAGDLGVMDPFRGGSPSVNPGERPNPEKEPDKYRKWFGANVARAMAQDAAAASTGVSLEG